MLTLLIYFGYSLIAIFAYLIIWAITMSILGVFKEHAVKWKDGVGVLTLILYPIASFLILSLFQVYPPQLFVKSISPEPSATQKQVAEIESKGKQLITAFAKPETLTLQQLRDLVDQARDYASQATKVNQIQEAQISILRRTVEEEGKRAEEAQRLTASIKSLTSEQLDAVKLLITKDAIKQSKQSFIYGVLASFPIGVIASMLATSLWNRIGLKRKEHLFQKIENKVSQNVSATLKGKKKQDKSVSKSV
jgi:hypothetical protein